MQALVSIEIPLKYQNLPLRSPAGLNERRKVFRGIYQGGLT
jgi:hypothetical protein